MLNEIIISTLLSIPVSIISGLCTGLVITRYDRFAQLRDEALRLIRRIDYIDHGQGLRLVHEDVVSPDFLLISSELYSLGHRVAGEQINRLWGDITETSLRAKRGEVQVEEMNQIYVQWQEAVRETPPNIWAIWSLRRWL